MSLDLARTVADAVLYEGYLLYPYRSTSSKNQARWQFGVLGPPGAAEAGVGEDPDLATECLMRPSPSSRLDVRLRFLQLRTRSVERADRVGGFTPVPELGVGDICYVSWDEAVEHELPFGPFEVGELRAGRSIRVNVPGGEDVESLHDSAGALVGRLVRRRWPLRGVLRLAATDDDGLVRLRAAVENVAPGPVADKDAAIRASFIGAHLLLAADGAAFISVIDPPDDARAAAARCDQRRCWPVLAGTPGETGVVLASPIILYDYPEVAPESAGALFDSTEIDEILTLRVMTLTDEEKAAARATDAHAAAIIDRCEQMSAEEMQRLHGILRDPHAGAGAIPPLDLGDIPTFHTPPADNEPSGSPERPRRLIAGSDPASDEAAFDTKGAPWWDPAADASVRPEVDSVLVNGVPVSKGSVVRVHPARRADAQDLFFAGQTARVTAVLRDVDGETHVAVVLADDPAAEMHDWYGRYLYFGPDELEPITSVADADPREESRS